jgi:hypothetical protein
MLMTDNYLSYTNAAVTTKGEVETGAPPDDWEKFAEISPAGKGYFVIIR